MYDADIETAIMTFVPYRSGNSLCPHPETVWPAPDRDDPESDSIAWVLRYGTPEAIAAMAVDQRFRIASILDSYATLVHVPTSAKQLPGLRAALRNGERDELATSTQDELETSPQVERASQSL